MTSRSVVKKKRGPPRFTTSNAVALQAICKLNTQLRTALLRAADPSLVQNICECALNTLRGNVKLTAEQKEHLRKHRKALRRLASNTGSWKSKKRLVIQHGGFLPLLLAPVIEGLVAALAIKLISG